jgi:hypothetical protein
MKSLASITEKDIETIKLALNDSISDMNTELKGSLSDKKRLDIEEYKSRYVRVYEKLRNNASLYALSESELDVVAGGLNDAIEMVDENITDDLTDEEREEILGYKDDCSRLVDILAT